MFKKNSFLLRHQRLVVLLAVIIFISAIILLNDQSSSYWLEYFWLLPVAFVISLIANTAGISGAALFVPFFIIIFPLIAGWEISAIDTVRLGLVTESFGLSSSALAFIGFGLIDMRLALKTIVWALPFVIIGAVLTTFIPESVLYIMIAVLLVIAAFLMRYGKEMTHRRQIEHKKSKVSYPLENPGDIKIKRKDKDGTSYEYCITKSGSRKRLISYGIGGFFQGAAGFGIGELGVISMIMTQIPVRIAIGTSHIIVAVTAITASVIHFGLVSGSTEPTTFPWNLLVMTIPAVALAGQVAPHLTAKISPKYLQLFVTLLFLVIAGALLLLATS